MPSSPSPLFDLTGRVILLTGAAGHLGRALARGLAEAGAHVLLNGRTAETLMALQAELQGSALKATALPFDIADEAAMAAALARLKADFGKLDGLINNASQGAAASIENDTPQNFDRAYSIAVSSPFSLIQATLPLLEAAGGASIINISSMYGTVSPDPSIYGNSGMNNPPHYGPSKAAQQQLTRYLACHLAGKKIRVNSISPGPFPPQALLEQQPDFHAQLCRKTPLARVGTPAELVGPAVFLLSDAASYVTGANLAVDGGWTAW